MLQITPVMALFIQASYLMLDLFPPSLHPQILGSSFARSLLRLLGSSHLQHGSARNGRSQIKLPKLEKT